MLTGPVGPVDVFFYLPKAVFGNFYWPEASGSLLPLSPVQVDSKGFYDKPCSDFQSSFLFNTNCTKVQI